MAHECPDCGSMCYCGGDIDDCLLNCDADVNHCTHCQCKRCGGWPDDCECYLDECFSNERGNPVYDDEES